MSLYDVRDSDGTAFAERVDLLAAFLVVGHQRIEYLRPLLFRPEPVAVDVWVSRLGSSSIDLDYLVYDPGSDVPYAKARTGMVRTAHDSGSPIALSAEQRRHLSALFGEATTFRQ